MSNYQFVPARQELRRLDEFYGQVVALTTTAILPSMHFPQWNRTVTNVPRVEVIAVSDQGNVTLEGETLVLPSGLANQMRDAHRTGKTLVGRLTEGQHPTNAEWTLITLADLTPEEAPAVFAALEAWAGAESPATVESSEGVPF